MSRGNNERTIRPFFRHAAATALFALASSPSIAVHCFATPRLPVFSGSHYSTTTSTTPLITSVRGGGRGRGRFSIFSRRQTKDASTTCTFMTSTVDETASATATTTATTTMTPASKLEALRSKMKELNMDVYLVPSDDPHLSEYVPTAYERRKFLTGFGGSAGTAVVTQDEAMLWTDSRYWNEASMQLDASCWKLMKAGQPDVPTITKYLAQQALAHYKGQTKPYVVGMDPFVHPATFADDVTKAFDDEAKAEFDDKSEDIMIGRLETSHSNLIDPIWGDARPEVPYSPFRVHDIEYAGVSVQDKVEKIRKEMETKKATLAVFSTLDDIAYLFNMRAMGDVDTCPVGIAYGTVSNDEVTLYCDSRKVESPAVQDHLKDVTIKPYEDIIADIQKHCEDKTSSSPTRVWLDASRSNLALRDVIPKSSLIDFQNAVTPMKACKNEAELEGMRKAHIVDGAAMAHFMAWMQDRIVEQGKSVSEVEIDQVLTGFRAEQPGFLECSFPTIAGVGSNAAIIHYRAQEGELMKYLDDQNPILLDSGGQYTYGTTDVTRTWHFGTPTDEFKDYFTRVLKGNIGVDAMIFPEKTPGFVLDVMARKALWQAGVDYGHGTGHGVGAALNVHEGPFSISPRFTNMEGLKPGMVVSNEPGYYEDGNFGIRIENLLEIACVKSEGEQETAKKGSKTFLKFKKLTMIPIQKNLIDVSLMSKEELDWLDAYHEEVFAKVSPLLEADSPAMKWLTAACDKIDRAGVKV